MAWRRRYKSSQPVEGDKEKLYSLITAYGFSLLEILYEEYLNNNREVSHVLEKVKNNLPHLVPLTRVEIAICQEWCSD